MHFRKLWIFPLLFSLGCSFSACLAFAPTTMRWFILQTPGHWSIWAIALPLGWTYGSTSANVLFGIRTDCAPKLKEFALSNVTFAASLGQTLGNIVAMFLSRTVPMRFVDMK